MTRYTPLWQQAGAYPASVDRGLLSTLWPASASTGATATLVTNTMGVSVAPGSAAVALAAGGGTELCRWDAAEVVTLTAAPPGGQSRVDLVVLQIRDATLDAGANNDFVFAAVTGIPAASNPATPATPTNAYKICEVTVPGGAANLNSATLTDRRSDLVGPTLGYVPSTATQSGISTEVDVTGCAVTVTVLAGRRIRITGRVGTGLASAADVGVFVLVKEGAAEVGRGAVSVSSTGREHTCPVMTVLTPTPGPHTYRLTLQTVGGTIGTASLGGAPNFILVEDIGSV
ncbi:MAG TPA: hypothetical protein VGP90_03625 [Acidimicrobiia bacterium]|jgi:hypothetical protein|nr:hypothetical protein [Acidimicrobiia bacterium]